MKTITPLKESHIRKNQQGSTIVETIVALVIFAIFITGATRVIMAHRQVSDKARAHYTAINIAKNQIEQVRNTLETSDFSQLRNKEERSPGIQVDSKGEPSDVGKFMRVTEINKINDDLAEIVVTVQILNRTKLTFGTENSHLKSYLSRSFLDNTTLAP